MEVVEEGMVMLATGDQTEVRGKRRGAGGPPVRHPRLVVPQSQHEFLWGSLAYGASWRFAWQSLLETSWRLTSPAFYVPDESKLNQASRRRQPLGYFY